MAEMMLVSLPAQYGVDFKVAGNSVRQIFRPASSQNLSVRTERVGRQDCLVATRLDGGEVLIVSRRPPFDAFPGDILRIRTSLLDREALSGTAQRQWHKIAARPNGPMPTAAHAARRTARVLEAWRGQFFYRQEDPAAGTEGLRPPQLGALFATLAHWTVTPEVPATVAMPTGTGKTETMLALLVEQRLPRVLVVVPNSALRDQITNKFLTLGILKRARVVSENAPCPVVGLMEHQFPDAEMAETFLRSCNVVIATMQAVNGCNEQVRRKLSEFCSHLFIDEAHHVKAPGWDEFRHRFHDKPIVQFTATPFRNDGKHIGGRMIYSYPLRKAQQEGYFKPIRFRPVCTFLDGDRQIALTALEQLREDLEAGLDHLVMARVDTIERANEVHRLYEEIAPEYRPLCIHSARRPGERREAIHMLRDRTSRIIVCVDMLGEGFDLPQLKIAALHDIHKSLAITLQFTGRFTRTLGGDESRVGDATMIANRARLDVREQLRALYAEDSDWNQVIRELGEGATDQERERSAFQQTFGSLPREVPIQNIAPKMSTVVYKIDGRTWNPDGVNDLYPEEVRYTQEIARSEQHRVIWFVTRETFPIGWGDVRELEDVIYHFYLLHWDERQNLLFINSSNNGSLHEELAQAVGGATAEIIRGDQVYRAMHDIRRLTPTNLGLLDLVSRARRFMMMVGADTTEGLDPAQSQSKTKTNIFGYGFEGGERVSIGCSLKGRIWSNLIADDIFAWVNWCHHIGAKLLDETITSAEIFRNFVKPVYVRERPALVPLAIEWPLTFLAEQEDRITIRVNEEEVPFFEAGLEIVEHARDRPIRFRTLVGQTAAEYQLSFGPDGTRYVPQGEEAMIRLGTRIKPLSEWFRQHGPKIHFEQDTFIEHDLLMQLNRDITPYDSARLAAWTWPGIDITRESQGPQRTPNTVQRHVINKVLASTGDWEIVFDDDDAGEVADVVAMRMDTNRLIVHLYHCKFSRERRPGSRVEDFYAVCGQAQKSVYWRERTGLAELFPHLVHREQQRLSKGLFTRFEKGNIATLDAIARRREILRPEFKVFVVQPGLSQASASRPVLELLAATSLYLFETFNVDFGVITSP